MSSKTIAERLRELGGAVNADMLSGLLGIAPVTLYKRAKAGKIPCFRVGASVRFDPVVIARWLDDNEVSR